MYQEIEKEIRQLFKGVTLVDHWQEIPQEGGQVRIRLEACQSVPYTPSYRQHTGKVNISFKGRIPYERRLEMEEQLNRLFLYSNFGKSFIDWQIEAYLGLVEKGDVSETVFSYGFKEEIPAVSMETMEELTIKNK